VAPPIYIMSLVKQMDRKDSRAGLQFPVSCLHAKHSRAAQLKEAEIERDRRRQATKYT
jgi:hypothetical protein